MYSLLRSACSLEAKLVKDCSDTGASVRSVLFIAETRIWRTVALFWSRLGPLMT